MTPQEHQDVTDQTLEYVSNLLRDWIINPFASKPITEPKLIKFEYLRLWFIENQAKLSKAPTEVVPSVKEEEYHNALLEIAKETKARNVHSIITKVLGGVDLGGDSE